MRTSPPQPPPAKEKAKKPLVLSYGADMSKLLRDMPLFVEAAKQKSFTRAAELLDMPLSTLSRRIIALEKAMGIPLFYRSARKVELTENGQVFFERCGDVVAGAEAAWEELASTMKSPRGRVRVSMPADIYHSGQLSGMLSSFALRWPDIQLHVHLLDRWVDLHSEPFDLDIRIGPLPDSSLKARRLTTLRPALYAAPRLLESYPLPQQPADLASIPCICMTQQGNVWGMDRNDVWTMDKDNHIELTRVRPAHMVNSVRISQELVLAGLGVGWLMPAVAAQYENSGQLVRLLPGWSHFAVDINVVIASSQMPLRVRLFVDHLVNFLAALPE